MVQELRKGEEVEGGALVRAPTHSTVGLVEGDPVQLGEVHFFLIPLTS